MKSSNLSIPSLVVGSAAAASMIAASIYLHYNDESASCENDDCDVVIPLLPLESSAMMMGNAPSPSSLTWYTLTEEENIETVEKYLRQRVRKILLANPWLGGKLVKYGAGKVSIVYKKKNTIRTSVEEEEIDKVFSVVSSKKKKIKITKLLPYKDLVSAVGPLLVPKGDELVRSGGTLFRVSLVPSADADTKGFALVTSLPHCIGDGGTAYALHSMLSKDRPIVALNARRKPGIDAKIEDALGGPEQASAMKNPNAGFVARFLKGMLASVFAGRNSTAVKLFVIPKSWIGEQKQKFSERMKKGEEGLVEWVSTNDILTSHFLATVGCDQGIMAMFFRGRLEDCCVEDAGNYFAQVILRPKDFESPGRIRMIVNEILKNNGSRQNNPETSSPMTSYEHFMSRKPFGCISNLSSFSMPVLLEGCASGVELTFPLLPTDPLSVPSRFTSGLFVFQPDATERIAGLFSGHPDVLAKLEATGMVGEELW